MGRPMIPRPMNPTLLISVSPQVRFGPAEAGRRCRLGLVLATDPPGIAELVDELEQERIVYLARSRLVSTWMVGQLHVPDARQVALDRRGQVALHDLHMVHVV